MTKIDLKKNFRSVKWTTEHTLSKEQLHKLIQDKTEREERFYWDNKAHIKRVRSLAQDA